MTSRSLSPWPTWPYRYGVVLVDVEEYTGSLNESLLILCSSLTKSGVEECDKSGQNSSCKYCESSMYIVHVCLAPGGEPYVLLGQVFLAPAGSPVDGHPMPAKVRNIKKLRTYLRTFIKAEIL